MNYRIVFIIPILMSSFLYSMNNQVVSELESRFNEIADKELTPARETALRAIILQFKKAAAQQPEFKSIVEEFQDRLDELVDSDDSSEQEAVETDQNEEEPQEFTEESSQDNESDETDEADQSENYEEPYNDENQSDEESSEHDSDVELLDGDRVVERVHYDYDITNPEESETTYDQHKQKSSEKLIRPTTTKSVSKKKEVEQSAPKEEETEPEEPKAILIIEESVLEITRRNEDQSIQHAGLTSAPTMKKQAKKKRAPAPARAVIATANTQLESQPEQSCQPPMSTTELAKMISEQVVREVLAQTKAAAAPLESPATPTVSMHVDAGTSNSSGIIINSMVDELSSKVRPSRNAKRSRHRKKSSAMSSPVNTEISAKEELTSLLDEALMGSFE